MSFEQLVCQTQKNVGKSNTQIAQFGCKYSIYVVMHRFCIKNRECIVVSCSLKASNKLGCWSGSTALPAHDRTLDFRHGPHTPLPVHLNIYPYIDLPLLPTSVVHLPSISSWVFAMPI